MAILRRTLLSVAFASPALAARGRRRQGRAQHGQSPGAADRGRVLLAHLPALRRVRPRGAAGTQGEVDRAGQAALGVLRLPDRQGGAAGGHGGALPAGRALRRFIDTLFATQDRWAFGTGNVADALWPLAGDGGMDRTTFDRRWPTRAAGLDRRAGAGGRAALARRCHSQLRDQRQALFRGDVAPSNLLQFSAVSEGAYLVRAFPPHAHRRVQELRRTGQRGDPCRG